MNNKRVFNEEPKTLSASQRVFSIVLNINKVYKITLHFHNNSCSGGFGVSSFFAPCHDVIYFLLLSNLLTIYRYYSIDSIEYRLWTIV